MGNSSVGSNWGPSSKVNKTPTISYEGVVMVGQGGLWDSAFASNLYWSDNHSTELKDRGFPCNSSLPPGMNWPGCSLKWWQQAGHDQLGAVTDPLFVDPSSRNFRLRDESPALAMGIKSIELSVGPRPWTDSGLDS